MQDPLAFLLDFYNNFWRKKDGIYAYFDMVYHESYRVEGDEIIYWEPADGSLKVNPETGSVETFQSPVYSEKMFEGFVDHLKGKIKEAEKIVVENAAEGHKGRDLNLGSIKDFFHQLITHDGQEGEFLQIRLAMFDILAKVAVKAYHYEVRTETQVELQGIIDKIIAELKRFGIERRFNAAYKNKEGKNKQAKVPELIRGLGFKLKPGVTAEGFMEALDHCIGKETPIESFKKILFTNEEIKGESIVWIAKAKSKQPHYQKLLNFLDLMYRSKDGSQPDKKYLINAADRFFRLSGDGQALDRPVKIGNYTYTNYTKCLKAPPQNKNLFQLQEIIDKFIEKGC